MNSMKFSRKKNFPRHTKSQTIFHLSTLTPRNFGKNLQKFSIAFKYNWNFIAQSRDSNFVIKLTFTDRKRTYPLERPQKFALFRIKKNEVTNSVVTDNNK